jgi:hypothetical protein
VISSGPSGTITTNEATFTFAGNPAIDTAKVQCRIDSAAFADCSSPKTFSGLTDGPHTVEFRAEDSVGNQDPTPASRTFTVDTTPPLTPKATIGSVGVSGPKSARKGRKTTYTVRISNTGDAAASGVKLAVTGKGVSARLTIGTIAARGSKTLSVRLNPKRTGSVKLTFRVTSSNAGAKSVTKKIKVRK